MGDRTRRQPRESCCFGRPWSARSPASAPPFSAAGAAVDFHVAAVQRHLRRRFTRAGDGRKYALPDSPLAPAREAIVDRLVWSIFAWAILPATPHLLNMHNPTQNPPIIMTLGAALLPWQMRLDLRPLLIVEPKQIHAHRLGSQIG